jgi:Na+/melibiose symporter-like transporter
MFIFANSILGRFRFTYLLVYLTRAHSIQLHSEQAAGVLLAGQVADAIATPLVGIFSDQSDGCLSFGFGRRKVNKAKHLNSTFNRTIIILLYNLLY